MGLWLSAPLFYIYMVEKQQRLNNSKVIRRQVVIDLIDRDNEDSTLAFFSIRVLTLNPDISFKMLRILANERANKIIRQLKYNPAIIQEGEEEKEILRDEERFIDDEGVYLQIQQSKEVVTFERIG